MSTMVIALEGVLGERESFDVTMQRSVAGFEFFTGFALYRRVIVTSTTHYDKAYHWLRVNGFRDFDMLLTAPEEALDHTAVRVSQLRSLRASRTTLSLFVDTDPGAVMFATRVGVTGLCWVPPKAGAQREDLRAAPIRSWEEMTGA